MFLKLYILALLVFVGIDMVWLGVIAKKFYQNHIGFLMKADVNWMAAILFYLLFISGLVFFVIMPAIERQSWAYACGAGAFFGVVAYATYDLTNLATVKNWPLIVTVVDLMWGAFLGAAVPAITYILGTKFLS